MVRAGYLEKMLRLLRRVPLPWLIGTALIYLFACAALVSLMDSIMEWRGPFRTVVDTWPVSTLWDCIVLAGLFAVVVFAALLKAEYRTFAFLTRQNITNVFGGRTPDPKSDFQRRAIVSGLVCAAYVTGAAIVFALVPGSGGFTVYFSFTYMIVAAVLIRQMRKRDLAALPLLSRVEVVAVIASPWIVLWAVVGLAIVNWLI